MEEYRAKPFNKLVAQAVSLLIIFIKRQLPFIGCLVAFIIVIDIALGHNGLGALMASVLIFCISIIWFYVIGILFPLMLTHKFYKNSRKQFEILTEYITLHKFNVDVVTSASELTFWDNLRFLGNRFSEIDYKFDKADVFETEDSLFIFPILDFNVKSTRFYKEYKPTIRIMKNRDEKIPGLLDVNPIVDFDLINDTEDVLIQFKDKNFQTDVTIRLKDYLV